MDFFEAQDHARSLSRRLIFLFVLAVAGLVAGVYLAVLLALETTTVGWAGGEGLFRPGLFLAVAGGMGILIGGGTLFRTTQLRKGGATVAQLLGGRRVDPATRDPRERVLLNVVEEMSIASGLPVPAVFVLDREAGLNAFAAGHTVNDAAVAVTAGMLETLSRDELQGVVAHEFSHILNGDMRLNVRLMGLLFGILLLTVVGRGIVRGSMTGRGRSGGGRGGSGGQAAIVGLALLVLGYLGVVVGRLIQAAVSRQREFLADSAAVEFTRNPSGLAGALKRIGAASAGSRIQDHHAQEAGHLFFAPGLRAGLRGLTATHPPLRERILRIDPRWEGSFEAGGEGVPAGASASGLPFAPLSGALVATAGAPGPHHLAHARALLESVPGEIREAVRTPEGALAVVLSLLLGDDPQLRERQVEQVTQALGGPAARRAAELHPRLAGVGPEARLPLLGLALPALRELPRERGAALGSAVGALIRADGQILPFEFAAFHLVRRNLPRGKGEAPPSSRPGNTALPRLRREAELLLSAVARSGSGEEARVEAAFRAGAALLPGEGREWRLLPAESVSLDRVDEALSRLEGAAPGVRREVLAAAEAVVLADGRVEVQEAEMLRALAEAMEVPVPPLLSAGWPLGS